MNLERLTGWKLDEARRVLSQDESTLSLPIQVVETCAPLKKIDHETERLGGWRVLRARAVDASVELTVAREQIVE